MIAPEISRKPRSYSETLIATSIYYNYHKLSFNSAFSIDAMTPNFVDESHNCRILLLKPMTMVGKVGPTQTLLLGSEAAYPEFKDKQSKNFC